MTTGPKLTNKPERQSGIELLRLVAILMVVGVHYFGKGGALTQTVAGTADYYFTNAMESLMIVGVNCFVLITGYFGVNQTGLKLRKIVDLMCIVAFWGAICYAAAIALGLQPFRLGLLANALFPYLFGELWFVRVYIMLALLSPFLNVALKALSKRAYGVLVALLLVFFSVLPTVLPTVFAGDGGYGLCHFIVMYVIGGYLRLHLTRRPPAWASLLGYAVLAGGCFAAAVMELSAAYSYNFIFAIASSVMLFLFFSGLHMRSRAVNFAAGAAFVVYVLNDNFMLRQWMYDDVMHTGEYYQSPYLPLHALLCIVLFFAAALLLGLAQRALFRRTLDRVLDKIGFLNTTYPVSKKADTDAP